MNENAATAWKLALAAVALLAGTAVYVLLRQQPPALLEPFSIPVDFRFGHPAIAGSAPSLVHTFAICLLIGACAATLSGGLRHCLLWVALAVGFEFSQLQAVAGEVTGWLDTVLPEALFIRVAPYWSSGVFDPLDIAATLAGGAIAMLLLAMFSRSRDAHTRR